MKVAKGYEVKFMLDSGDVYKFDGFNESVSSLRISYNIYSGLLIEPITLFYLRLLILKPRFSHTPFLT